MTQNDGTKSVEIYFPNGSTVGSRLGPVTTARQLCLDIRLKLGLKNDADFGLFEEIDGRYDAAVRRHVSHAGRHARHVRLTITRATLHPAGTSTSRTIHSLTL